MELGTSSSIPVECDATFCGMTGDLWVYASARDSLRGYVWNPWLKLEGLSAFEC